jgi:hypothetical protein
MPTNQDVFVVRLERYCAQPIKRADRSFTSLLSARFACIDFLHLRWNSCFSLLPTSNRGRVGRPASRQWPCLFDSAGG